MRGHVDEQPALFHFFNVEARIRSDHPLRDVKRRVDRLLADLSPQFAKAYSRTGRPSVPPERLLKALLLMAIYSIRSERQLCERLDTDLLFRWFLELSPSEEAFDATTFSHNRQRLDAYDLTRRFFDAVVAEALAADLCSEHFSVDGTLIESQASAKSFQPKAAEPATATPATATPATATPVTATPATPTPATPTLTSNGFKPRNADVDFHGQKRTNATHASRTDPEAKLYRKSRGQEAKLSHMGHTLIENRHGLIMEVQVTEANGTAERVAALDMLDRVQAKPGSPPKTLGADKGYDAGAFFEALESRGIEPHVPLIKAARNPENVRSAQERREVEARCRMRDRMASEGYRVSQRCRKKIEEGFGWLKTIAGLERSRVVGRWKLRQLLEMGAAAFNLVRLRKLKPA